MLKKLGILDIEKSDIKEVLFSDDSLIKVTRDNDDWKLTSLQAFTSEEELRIITERKIIKIIVTDSQNNNSTTVRDMVSNPDYGKQHAAGKLMTDYPIESIPLEKDFQIKGNIKTIRDELRGEEFIFDITPAEDNPLNGAEISPDESYSLQIEDIINTTPVQGEYMIELNPWSVKFKKEGIYKFLISERNPSEEKNYLLDYDSEVDEFVFCVVEEEGVLRVAEAYRSKDDEINADQYGAKLRSIPATALFHVDTAIASNGEAATVSQSGGKIILNMKHNSSAVITSVFTMDFSRSFSIQGNAKIPGSDSMTIAFQDNPKKKAFYTECTNALDPVYYGGAITHNCDGYGGSLKAGYTVPLTKKDDLGNTMDSMKEGYILQYVSKDACDGMFSYRIDGNKRIPYAASSGLENKTYSIPKENTNVSTPFSIRFECKDRSNGTGKLTIILMGQTIVYDNFVASTIMPNVWQAAHLTVAANVDHLWSGQLVLESETYDETLLNENYTTFWADRNEDGVFETQINSTNSPAVPGETILVRHALKRQDSYDFTYYERVLVRQIRDITAGKTLSASEAHSYRADDLTTAVRCDCVDNAFNNDILSNGLWMAAFPGAQGFNFEYKITAPDEKNHYVTEQALFGQEPFGTLYTDSYGFRTESIVEQKARFQNAAETFDISYDVNGGKFLDNTTSIKSNSALKGSTFRVLEVPVKEGNIFAGWKVTSPSGVNETYQEGDTFTVDKDITLTAQWVERVPLTITNTVTGGMGDKTKEFTVKFTIASSDTYSWKKNGEVQSAELKSGDTFTMKHGDSIEIAVPVNKEISLEETNADTYKTTFAYTGMNGTPEEDADTHKTTFKLNTTAKSASVALTNNQEKVAPTGVQNNFTPFILILAAGAAGVYVAFRKKRA